jgi:membrane protein
MGMRDAFAAVKETWQEFQDDGADRQAAALAYYIVFSLAPLLVVVTAIAGAVFDEASVRRAIFDQVRQLVGADGASAMHDMMERAHEDRGGTIATVLGVVAMVLGASGVFLQLQSALNTVWGVRTKPRPFLKGLMRERLFSLAMVFAAGFLLVVSLVVNAGVAAVTKLLAERIPGAEWVWQAGYWVLSTAATAIVIAFVFRTVPDVRIRLRDVVAGALWTALLFALGQILLGYYLGRSAFATTYGAAGSFVVVLVWIYYSSQVLLFGAELTQVMARRKGVPIVPTANAESVRGPRGPYGAARSESVPAEGSVSRATAAP